MIKTRAVNVVNEQRNQTEQTIHFIYFFKIEIYVFHHFVVDTYLGMLLIII